MSRSTSTSTPTSPSRAPTPTPKPPRGLLRSPSDPVHLSQAHSLSHPHSHSHSQSQPHAPNSPNQPIYVLTADGSSLFLLDPSKPQGGEEPPPYASFTIPSFNGNGSEGGGDEDAAEGEGSRTFGRAGEMILSRSGTALNRYRGGADHEADHHAIGTGVGAGAGGAHRNRARTLSAVNPERFTRPRYRTTTSHPGRRTRSALSTPEVHNVRLMDENTPLLIQTDLADGGTLQPPVKRRGTWRSICCGDVDVNEEVGGWGKGWKRFWRPIGRGEYWRSLLHLVLLNFPFALLVWPPLVAGTLAGTALLITLPIGAAVWWLTLFISRSAARLETIMQLHHHRPLTALSPQPIYHPIFYRLSPRSVPNSPLSPPESHYPFPRTPSIHSHGHGHTHNHDPHREHDPEANYAHEGPSIESPSSTTAVPMVWEKRFMKCSYAMFLDHYSYSALSYFLLIKPLITLFSTIVIIVLFPIGFVTIIGLPVYLRLLRKWGKWQAEVALENL